MTKYLLKRIGLIFFTLFITLSIAFLVIRMMPNNPIDDPVLADQEELIEKLKEKYGYDKPYSTQYWLWLKAVTPHYDDILCSVTDVTEQGHACYELEAGAVIGKQFILSDWGDSLKLRPGTPVSEYIKEKIPISMVLNIFSLFISIPLGIFLGTVAALKKNSYIDNGITVGIIFFISVPIFVTASLMRYYLGFQFEIFEVVFDPNIPEVINSVLSGDGFPYINKSTGSIISPDGIDPLTGNYVAVENVVFWSEYIKMLSSLVMPIVALSFGAIAGLARYTRAELTEVLTNDFMLLAKSKGLTRTQATIRHAFRNSMVPLVGMIVGMFVGILGGSLIIENIFAINGMGQVTLKSITSQDYSITLGAMAFYSTISLFTILLVDILYGVVDPRIRLGGRG